MTLETYANQFVTSLSGNGGSITSVQTTINIASGTGAPSGASRFVIDNEIITGSISGTVLTATNRGAEGTTRTTHTDGTTVSCVLTAASLLASPGVKTTKGDIEVGIASGEPSRLAVGSNTQVLTADSTQTTGVKWATPAPGVNAASPTLTLSTSNATGSAGTYVNTDATIAAFDATVPVTQALGDTAATGSAGTAARRDHKHAVTNPMTTKGDLIAGGTSGAVTRLAVGSDTQVLTADSTQTTGVKWAAASGGGGGINGAGLLAIVQYDPAGTSYSPTTSVSAVDTTNLTLSFVAPSSGKVMAILTANARASNSSNGDWMEWYVLTHSTTTVLGAGVNVMQQVSQGGGGVATQPNVSARIYVTGLTAGTTYSWDWGFRTSGTGATQTTIQVGSSGNANSPMLMEVYDATIQGAGGGGQPVFATQQATVATSETTTSTTYADLATSGPAVTVVVPNSGKVRVSVSADCSNGGTGDNYMGFALTSGNTVVAADANALRVGGVTSVDAKSTYSTMLTGLTPGSTVFTAKYRVVSGTGTFVNREICVEPVDGDVSGVANPMTTAGDLIVGGVSGAASRLAAATNTQALTLVSGTPAWTGDTSWTAVTFASGWSNVASSVCAYRKDAMGMVHCKGQAQFTGNANTRIFTLGSGYRPAEQQEYFAGEGTLVSSQMPGVDVNTDGTVVPFRQPTSGTTVVPLSGIHFFADGS